MDAASAQTLSHLVEQQYESTLHIFVVHSGSSEHPCSPRLRLVHSQHNGGCDVGTGDGVGDDVVIAGVGYGVPLQTIVAASTHKLSHPPELLQQYGSIAQILSVHSESDEHP